MSMSRSADKISERIAVEDDDDRRAILREQFRRLRSRPRAWAFVAVAVAMTSSAREPKHFEIAQFAVQHDPAELHVGAGEQDSAQFAR